MSCVIITLNTNYENKYENCDHYFNLYNNNYDELKNILSNKIDNDNVNSEILHIFPITLSCVITLFASIKIVDIFSYIFCHY